MDDLLADFLAETREMLEAIEGEIVAWEGDPSDKERLDAIFRFVHTVKGNCGFFDFPRLAGLSHAAEDALAECRAGRRTPDARLVSAVLAIIDRITDMATAIEDGREFPPGGDDELIQALENDQQGNVIEPARVSEAPEGEKAAPDPEASTNNAKAAPQRSIRLTVDLLDEMMKGVSDLVLARNDLARRLRDAGEQPEVEGSFDRLSGILGDVRQSITRMRMLRLENLFSSLPRLVRDLSSDLGKQVMVDFEGGDVELDREMIELIRDPITHIIRNAIDHGIEKPTDRLGAGKREIGLLHFSARQSGNEITLVISDDGHGIDTDKLAAKALEAGLYSREELQEMTPQRKLYLMFEAGLSTADEVSSVSGRGVGMDVVRANIEKLGGLIDVRSTPGEGTSFHLRLPLTLSIMSALTVVSDEQLYALPYSFVEEIVLGRSQNLDFTTAGKRQMVRFRDRRVPCIALNDILGMPRSGDASWKAKTILFIRMASDDIFALGVDKVNDHEDVVVKPLAPSVMATGLYAGTTLLDDGRPMMLLDVASIAAMNGLVAQEHRIVNSRQEQAIASAARKTMTVMVFTDLDGTKRGVRLPLVARIDTIGADAIDRKQSRVQVVIDGALLPMAGAEHGELDREEYRVLRLRDGENDLAYLVDEVHDTVDIDAELDCTTQTPGAEGNALIDGKPVPIIDVLSLFANYNWRSSSKTSLTCRIPPGSDWARNILEPLVAATGYEITEDPAAPADVTIELDDTSSDVTEGESGAVIRLRSEREAADDSENSIYRYDRDGLMHALSRIRNKQRSAG